MAPRKVSRCERIEVKPEVHDLALRRTDYLLNMPQRTLQDLIANAWVQGVLDAAEHMAMTDAARGGEQ